MKIKPMPIKRNKFTKLIALVLALALWFYVASLGQMNAQFNTQVDLEYINKGDNLVVSGPDEVSVKMWGTVSEAGWVQEAYVNLAGLGPGTYTLPVQLRQTNRALVTKVEPDKVEVAIAELTEGIKAIVPRSQNVLAEGYELTDIITVPEQCAVQGEESAVSRVHTVTAPVNLASTTEMQTLTVNLQALDKEGEIVDGVRLIPARATVYAVVSQKMASKKVPLRVVTQGEAAEGFQVGEISIEPREVFLAGSQGQIEEVSQVETRPVDISGSTSSLAVNAELVNPVGVKVFPAHATVYIEIVPVNPTAAPPETEENQPEP